MRMAIVMGEGADARLRQRVGAELYARQHAVRHLCVPIDGGAYFVAFYVTDVRGAGGRDMRVSLYVDGDELIVASESEKVNGLFREMRSGEKPAQALTEFMGALTEGDVDALELIENDINALDDALISSKEPLRDAIARIIALRRALLNYKRYYEQLEIVLGRLTENENDAFTREETEKLGVVERRVSRLVDAVSHLREGVTQARVAYQARIDIEQNQIMKIFTVITAIFLPLTLIVGWYGMNFRMPEYGWRYGYLYVAILSAIVCAALFLIIRRKKWF
jgi:magnesium transporter